MAGLVGSQGVFFHNVVVHESLPTEQREASGTTKYAADHVLRRLLQPMADSVLEHLVPHHRSCTKKYGIRYHILNKSLITNKNNFLSLNIGTRGVELKHTGANRVNTAASRAQVLVLLHQVDKQTNSVRLEVDVTVQGQKVRVFSHYFLAVHGYRQLHKPVA